ncbi:hypothetical protein COV18_01045 [Candidatus Woesearchaeota archaeon CG10_big_fil_rev_8_21_14_0_10_37_12]|nr:MAG: hypothetical protein COV18_01045 [Candidatus Woesearchaeota archaeon CG10_big_fil_rev_8_21_14_0_10_37_12]
MKAFTVMMLLLVSLVAVSAASDATIPVFIKSAEIDGVDVEPFGINTLDIERNENFELRLELESTENVDDVIVTAFISGYEFDDVRPIRDSIGPIDLDAGITYVRRLQLSLPKDVDVDSYKLRVDISDRNSLNRIFTYDLRINTERHWITIEDVVLKPGSAIRAGEALLASVRVENRGQRDEDDIRITVSVPELGLSDTQYVEEVEVGEEDEGAEHFLPLPKCADPGVYEVKVDVAYNEGHDRTSANGQITVLENEDCRPAPEPVVVVQEQPNMTEQSVEEPAAKNSVRRALEVILLILVALLVVVGLIIGFTRMNN